MGARRRDRRITTSRCLRRRFSASTVLIPPLPRTAIRPASRRRIGQNQYSISITLPVSTSNASQGRSGSQDAATANSPCSGEIWPAIYEKAYAKYVSNNRTDCPPYPVLSNGTAADALRDLCGLTGQVVKTSDKSANGLYSFVACRTVAPAICNAVRLPMVASTYNLDPEYFGGSQISDLFYRGTGLHPTHSYT